MCVKHEILFYESSHSHMLAPKVTFYGLNYREKISDGDVGHALECVRHRYMGD